MSDQPTINSILATLAERKNDLLDQWDLDVAIREIACLRDRLENEICEKQSSDTTVAIRLARIRTLESILGSR